MFGLLSGIVLRGSRTIDRHHESLEQRVGELSRLLAQNVDLRDRVQRASRRTAELNEQYLRRIGADLHDGRPSCWPGLNLPELDDLPPRSLLKKAAEVHERRTRTTVEVEIQSAPDNLEKSMKICLYRFVQEALSNAFRHGGETVNA